MKNSKNEIEWAEIVVACRAEIVEDFFNDSGNTVRKLKGAWKRRLQSAAKELGVKIKTANDNWYIIEKVINSKKEKDSPSSSKSNKPSKSSNTDKANSSSKSSNSSLLGYKLTNSDKEAVKNMYGLLKKEKMWKLCSGRYVEEIMKEFSLKLNYEQ